jgi:hypothetical protein
LTQICTLPISLASAQLHPTWYASALSRVGSYLAPAPLFAQPPFGDCGDSCIGGLPSDWSPFSPSGIVAGNVVLTIVTQPKDVKEVLLSGAPNDPVTIRATANGLPVPGVVVDSIEVFNNSGSPAGAIVTAFNAGAPTGSNGQTTATFGIGKPGGYLIVIFASLDGSSTKTVTSAMFHIKNS